MNWRPSRLSKKNLAIIIAVGIIAIILGVTLATPTLTYTLSASVNPPQAGSISPSGGEYEPDEEVTLTATAANGYAFDYWSGSEAGTSPTVTLTMDSDKSLTANFKAITTVTHNLTISINGQGIINPSEGIYKYPSGTQVTINVSAISGWDFDHWSGDATGTSHTIVITMDSDKRVTAYFEDESIILGGGGSGNDCGCN
jgi:autotransporter family porin